MATRLERWSYLLIGWFGTSRPVTRLHPLLYRRLHAAGPLGHPLGHLAILLTTTGVRSGRPRTVPLFAFPDGERLIVVASNAGRDRVPGWYRNLAAHAEVTVETPHDRWPALARTAEATERARLWALVVAAYPGYEVYRRRAARGIPVVILEPLRRPASGGTSGP